MISASGRYVITYNGEIYSAAEIRPELEALGHRFRGHSDTEVIVEAVDEWGVPATIKRLIGMFAFAIWDRKERRLTLARDRLGIKPLYFGRQNGRIVFASELKAFEALPGWKGELNQDALASYLRLSYVPSPHSIYRGIDKLAPGHIATIDSERQDRDERLLAASPMSREQGHASPLDVGDAEATDIARGVARRRGQEAARRRRAARRVPVGRDRFIDRRGDDAREQHITGADLFDRLR